MALALITKASLARPGSFPEPDFTPRAVQDNDVAAPADASAAALRKLAVAEVREGDYWSNDIVELRGDLRKSGSWELKINGAKPLKLNRRSAMVFRILASYALLPGKQNRKSKRRPLPVAIIVEAILSLTADGTALAGFWPSPSETDVHRTVYKIRGRLRQEGHSILIESGPRMAGYRISVLPLGRIDRGVIASTATVAADRLGQ